MTQISFNQIPANWLVPGAYVEIDNSKAVGGIAIQPAKALIIGQRLSTGETAALELFRVADPDIAIAKAGRGSMLAGMVAAFRERNPSIDLYAMALDDLGAGTAAIHTVTFGGAATQAGTLALYVAGTRTPIAVTTTQTNAQRATAFAAAVNAETDLPVTAAVDGSVDTQVNLTFRHKGLVGSELDIRVGYFGERTPPGVTVTIAEDTAGAGNPDITDALDALDDSVQYKYIVHPYTDAANLTALETELAARFGPMQEVASHAFTTKTGTHSECQTLIESRNSPHSVPITREPAPEMPYIWSAQIAAETSLAAEIDPARPFQTLATSLMPPKVTDRWDPEERNLHLIDGGSTTYVDAGGVVRIERLVTSYKSNAYGSADPSYRDLNTLLITEYIRKGWIAWWTQRYPRSKLADDGTLRPPNSNIVTPLIGLTEIIAYGGALVERGIIESINRDLAISERDPDDSGVLRVLLPYNYMDQQRALYSLLQFRD